MTSGLRLTRRGWAALALLALVAAGMGAYVTTRVVEPQAAVAVPSRPGPAVAAALQARPADHWAPAVGPTVTDDPFASLAADGVQDLVDSLVTSAPVVVAASAQQPVDLARARLLAAELRAPLVLSRVRSGALAADTGVAPRLREAVDVWGTRIVVAVGDVVVPPGVTVRRWTVGATPPEAIRSLIDDASASSPSLSGVALVRRHDGPLDELISAAHAVGLDLHVLADAWAPPDDTRAALAGADRVHLLGSADDWADIDPTTLGWHLSVLRAGHELPGGGYRMFPDRRLVALYGHPEGPALGLLGEQGIEDAIQRAREHAEPYAELSDVPVVPAFEIIATIASASAGSRGDYSRRTPISQLEPWVDAAGAAGLYVVLDLQPGRTDFLTQAQEYEELLKRPHVGLALDPEWRLKPTQVHLRQIGSVGIDEVNAVGEWLADLTRDNALPQKLFVLHQFRLDMIRERERLATDRPELAYLIHVDGQGGQPAKDATYRHLTGTAPPPVAWGWKNFYDEDIPGLRSPEDTMAVTPTPDLITFQ